MSYNIIQQFLIDPSKWGVSIYLAEAIVKIIKKQSLDSNNIVAPIEFHYDGDNGFGIITCKSDFNTFSGIFSKLVNINRGCHYIEYLNTRNSWSSDIAKLIVSDRTDVVIWGTDVDSLLENLKDYFHDNDIIGGIINSCSLDISQIISGINKEVDLSLQLYYAEQNGISSFNEFDIEPWMISITDYSFYRTKIIPQCSALDMSHEEIPAEFNVKGEIYFTKQIKRDSLRFIDFSDFDFSKFADHKIVFYGPSVNIKDAWKGYGRSRYKQPFIIFVGLYNVEKFIYNGSKICGLKDMGGMFSDLSELRSIDLSKIDSSECRNMSGMFGGCYHIETLDIETLNFDKCEYMEGMFSRTVLSTLSFESKNAPKCKSMSKMFSDCGNLEFVNLDINTPKCENMSCLFESCEKLKSINFSNFDTTRCKDMSGMFMYCKSLEFLDLSGLDVVNCQTMREMFSWCSNLKYILLPKNALRIKEMREMFNQCGNLKSIDFSQCRINCDNPSGAELMFSGCTSLREINLSNCNFLAASYMFNECKSLQTIIMKNCSSEMIDGIKKQLKFDGIHNVKIVV